MCACTCVCACVIPRHFSYLIFFWLMKLNFAYPFDSRRIYAHLHTWFYCVSYCLIMFPRGHFCFLKLAEIYSGNVFFHFNDFFTCLLDVKYFIDVCSHGDMMLEYPLRIICVCYFLKFCNLAILFIVKIFEKHSPSSVST